MTGESKKRKQCFCKPGSVPQCLFRHQSACHLSNLWVTPQLKRSTLHRPYQNERATRIRWFTRTCSLQRAQPDDHPSVGGLLHRLLTLAIHRNGGCFLLP